MGKPSKLPLEIQSWLQTRPTDSTLRDSNGGAEDCRELGCSEGVVAGVEISSSSTEGGREDAVSKANGVAIRDKGDRSATPGASSRFESSPSIIASMAFFVVAVFSTVQDSSATCLYLSYAFLIESFWFLMIAVTAELSPND